MVILVPLKFTNFWCNVSSLKIADTVPSETVVAIMQAIKDKT
jgi:hypothetical protein